MINAYLTIDDITSNNTKSIIDYLCEKNIQAVLFAWGERLEKNYDAAIYAISKGMIIGNHTYSHPFFSDITLEEGILEIERCEELLNKLYKEAGVKREHKLFRFPYDDKGSLNKETYQKYLRDNGFTKLDDTEINLTWWDKYKIKEDIDTFWTFDFEEYNIREDSDFSKEDVVNNINIFFHEINSGVVDNTSKHIFVIHDHDETEKLVPEYYRIFIDEVIKRGGCFIKPAFI